jgi:serine/threonine-protein kinase HipA
LLLMDKLFRQAGRQPATLSPLDRLAFLGDRAMGALTFEPAEPLVVSAQDDKLLDLAREAQALIQGCESQALMRLALLGGSPHGARPKVLIYCNEVTRSMGTQPQAVRQ